MADFEQMFDRIRDELIAHRDVYDRNLSRISPEAQRYAVQIRDIFMDRSKSGAQCRNEIIAIKQSLPADIRDELDDHKHRTMREICRARDGEGRQSTGRRSGSRQTTASRY